MSATTIFLFRHQISSLVDNVNKEPLLESKTDNVGTFCVYSFVTQAKNAILYHIKCRLPSPCQRGAAMLRCVEGEFNWNALIYVN